MADKFEEDEVSNKCPEKPLECSECKKPISVCYTEIIGQEVTRISLCADCPELHKRLHRETLQQGGYSLEENVTGMACGNCGTTFDALRVGVALGCSTCYEVFNEILINEILAAEKIPPRLATLKKSIPIHIGRAPGENPAINPSLRLLALNEALSETVKKEDYEQAAWLRDQIKALIENPEKKDENE